MLGFIVIGLLVLAVSALLFLDWAKKHGRATAALDKLHNADEQADGLALIEVGDLSFRARVANLGGSGDALILLHGFPQALSIIKPINCARYS